MSNDAPTDIQVSALRGKTIVFVASLYNERFVDGLLDAALAELSDLMPEAAAPVFRVPGAFEIPVCVRAVSERLRPDAIVALGVIIRGKTAHADLVAQSVTASLQETATMHLIPVIHEVLLVEDEDQATRRTLGTEINRGGEAARAAVNMVELFHKLESALPPKRSR